MADEIQIALQEPGLNVYAAIRNIAGEVWDTSVPDFVAISSVDWADADIPLADQDSTGDYFGDMPSGIPVDDTYVIEVFERRGATPERKEDWLITSAPMYWDGTILYYSGEFAQISLATH